MRTFIAAILLLVLTSCEKKYGEPFTADLDILSQKPLKSVRVVDYEGEKEGKTYYLNPSIISTPITTSAIYKYSSKISFNMENNEHVLFKLEFEDKGTVDYRIMYKTWPHEGKATNGFGATSIILTSTPINNN